MGFQPKKFAALTELTFDKTDNLFYGLIASYPVTVQYIPNRKLLVCRVTGKDNDNRPASEIQQELDNFRVSRTGIVQISYQKRELAAIAAIPSRDANEGAAETLRALVSLAAHLALEPCCEGCGASYGWDFYALDGSGVVICDACRSYTEQNMADIREQKSQEKANVAGLAAGIVCGTAVLFLLTYLLLRMGYVAYITGYIGMLVGFLAMKKWGKKLTIPAVIIALVIGIAVAAITPVISISKDIAEFHMEKYGKCSEYNQTISEVMEQTKDMNADEKKEVEELMGYTFAELKQDQENNNFMMAHTTTSSCVRDFGQIWKNPIYKDVHKNVIECIIWGLASILIGSALTLPAMLKESKGIHKLRRLIG